MDTLNLKIGDQSIRIARTPADKLAKFRARLAMGNLWDAILIELFCDAVIAGAERFKKDSAHKGHVTQNIDGATYEKTLADFCKFNNVPMPSGAREGESDE